MYQPASCFGRAGGSCGPCSVQGPCPRPSIPVGVASPWPTTFTPPPPGQELRPGAGGLGLTCCCPLPGTRAKAAVEVGGETLRRRDPGTEVLGGPPGAVWTQPLTSGHCCGLLGSRPTHPLSQQVSTSGQGPHPLTPSRPYPPHTHTQLMGSVNSLLLRLWSLTSSDSTRDVMQVFPFCIGLVSLSLMSSRFKHGRSSFK